MNELEELRKTVEALTARIMLIEAYLASEMDSECVDPIEEKHRANLLRLRDQ